MAGQLHVLNPCVEFAGSAWVNIALAGDIQRSILLPAQSLWTTPLCQIIHG